MRMLAGTLGAMLLVAAARTLGEEPAAAPEQAATATEAAPAPAAGPAAAPEALAAADVPKAADPRSHGQVDFEFVVDRDGSVSNVHMLASSNVAALDRAARNALLGSQLKALPSDFAPSRVTMGLTFWYDERTAEPDRPSAK